MRHLMVWAGTAAVLTVSAARLDAQGYRPPDCELSTGHFLVNSAVVYLKSASEEADQVKKRRMLGDAYRNLMDAIDRGQAENPAVWYFLGRYYVMQGDAFGADSAFDRAERMKPECAEDITFHRQLLWVPIINRAIDSLRQGAFDGAKDVLREANAIYDKDNLGFYYLARIFGNEGETDSALVYFRKVVDIGVTDSTREENYTTSVFNIGLLYTMMEQWDSAAVWFAKYREIDPEDSQALTQLAQAVQKSGDTTRAMMLYDSVLARADKMDAIDLFKTGEALFIAEQFHTAAQAFELGLQKNKYFRPGLYNLANAYLAICNDEAEPKEVRDESAKRMEVAARRLVEVDPYNAESMRLLAAAYQLQRLDDSTLAVLERIEALPFEVQVDLQQPIRDGYMVQGRLTNPKTAETAVPDITFEFLDGEGNVIVTDTVAATTLGPKESTGFELTAQGEGIVAARYTVGSQSSP